MLFPSSSRKLIGLFAILVLVSLSGFFLTTSDIRFFKKINTPLIPENDRTLIDTFKDKNDFLAYIANVGYSRYENLGIGAIAMRSGMTVDDMTAIREVAPAPTSLESGAVVDGFGPEQIPSRFSETNVRVSGIDEPDIVKTNGSELFVSTPYYGRIRPMFFDEPEVEPFLEESDSQIRTKANAVMLDEGISPVLNQGGIKAVKAFPPGDLAIEGEIDLSGDLLLYEDTLIVFSSDGVRGYDISDARNPKEIWENKLDSKSRIVTSRLYNGKIYMITSTWIQYRQPCPVIPLEVNGEDLVIPCNRIYYPTKVVATDSTYTAMVVDPDTGNVIDSISFTGSQGQSVVYMSKNNIYIAGQQQVDMLPFMTGFLSENPDIIPSWVTDKLKKLMSYDIGRNAKMAEFSDIMAQFQSSLDEDEMLKLENEFENRMNSYYERFKRDLTKTIIAKVSINEKDDKIFNMSEYGTVPGRLLNSFSIDEYDGYLRVATTIDGQRIGLGRFGRTGESVNDLYVLDENMNVAGSVLDMGRDERIFSARFIGNLAYLVTFKQIDPFFVLDLSNPRKPKIAGELKIPGFSSYLHPLKENTILGVGRENSKVKLSIFDVSNPSNPVESSKYLMSAFWSDVQNTHRAFLQDSKNELFFIPAGRSGYIFSYSDDTIKLEKAISDINAKRAVFIDEYFYIIGTDKIVVVSLKDYERVNELSLRQ